MRILIDGSALLLPGGGVKSYLYYWLCHLERLAKAPDSIRIFPFLGDDLGRLNHSRSNYGGFPTGIRLALVRTANRCGSWMTDLLCQRADLFHESNTHVLYPPGNCKLTATVHDMTCWLMPDLHVEENIAATKRFAACVLARADRLIAVSHNTKCDAAEILRIPEDRIEVIHHGVAEEFFHVSPDEIRCAAGKYELERPYILFTGTLEPRKNAGNLIDAYLRLSGSLRNDVELVLAGPSGWRSEQLTNRLRSGVPGVRWLGYVAEADLPGLTAGAMLFAYPSLYEGFGLPVAQAMAAGVPVVTSNVSSLPEIAGDAAILVDPKSPEEICAALERLLADASLRERLAANGASRATAYCWDACATKSLAFFHSVCGS